MTGRDIQEARRLLEADWPFWARAAQLAPAGDWSIWLYLGGRGAGKTRAGAEWVRRQVADGARRVALVGPTFADVREVMIGGPSGLASLGPGAVRPHYCASRRRLEWPNGALAYGFSAEDPDALRGPQFEFAWADEFGAWRYAQETLDMLRLGLRLGEAPRLAVTTTPRATPALKKMVAAPGVVITRSASRMNRASLAPGFVEQMEAAYGASRFARQELEGVLIEDPEGALWTRALVDQAVRAAPFEVERIVVGVDPPAGAAGGPHAGDECGLVVAASAGADADLRLAVLADRSLRARPEAWARAVADAFAAFDADFIVAEANQGGDMVRAVLDAAAPGLPVRLVRASRGKRARAEPIAALYAAGRVRHAGRFAALEDQMCAFGSPDQNRSPDRVDALVWALSALSGRNGEPRLRRL